VAKGLKTGHSLPAMLVVDHEGTVSLTQRLTLEDQTPKLDLGEPLRAPAGPPSGTLPGISGHHRRTDSGVTSKWWP